MQEYLEFFADYNDAAESLLAALDRPAARQLLLVHHSPTNELAGGSITERGDFQSAMDTMGYPTNCKTIAISNGSGFGEKQPFSPGEKIINWTDGGGLFEQTIDSEVFALPQSAAPVFKGDIRFIIPIASTTVNSYHPLPLDNAPGGERSTFYQLFTNIPPEQTSGDDYCAYTNHCFIPTVSALGIPLDNIESNLAFHAELTALSPFDEIHYGIDNEPHVEINTRNKRWVMRAVLEVFLIDTEAPSGFFKVIGTPVDPVTD